MKSIYLFSFLCLESLSAICGEHLKYDADSPEANEALAMISSYHLAKQPPSLAYQSAAIKVMLQEANYFSERLKLPTSRPIQLADVKYPLVFSPWFSTLNDTRYPYWPITIFTNHIFDSTIPREQRVRAIKIGAGGGFETTNFAFGFKQGRLTGIERLNEHDIEYFSKEIDKLFGKESLITESQAHQLATQWLDSVNVDVLALENKHKPEVTRLRILAKDSTNVFEVPFYFVHWGKQYFTNNDEAHTVISTPLVEIKILGTTKEFVALRITDTTFSRRPLLLITNAFELIRVTNPTVKHIEVPTNAPKFLKPQQE